MEFNSGFKGIGAQNSHMSSNFQVANIASFTLLLMIKQKIHMKNSLQTMSLGNGFTNLRS